MVLGHNKKQAGDHAPVSRNKPYWMRGRKRAHYLSGAISMTRDGMERDRLQALGTCVHIPPNTQFGQRGPWGMEIKTQRELVQWADPRGSYARRPRGKRRGKGRTLRPAVVARQRAGR
jgi:hypothetical protein